MAYHALQMFCLNLFFVACIIAFFFCAKELNFYVLGLSHFFSYLVSFFLSFLFYFLSLPKDIFSLL